MDTSMFIAQLLAVVYLAVGLGLLLSGDYYKKAMAEMVKSHATMYLGGVMALLAGFLIVSFHNVWEGWPILVTLIGWLALVKGLVLLIFPEWMMDWSSKWVNKNWAWYAWVPLVLGALFGYFGFFA